MIAIIPARGGSKGLPGKNIKLLLGKPLISYTINAAKEVKKIDKIIVSTDDKEIAKVSDLFGAECPFLRPAHLAADDSLAIDNYIYTLNRIKSEYKYYSDEFIVLQPTSPLRTSKDIVNSIDLFQKKQADSLVSFTELEHPPSWAMSITNEGKPEFYFNNSINTEQKNRQEYPKAYVPNGAVFIFRLSLLEKYHNYFLKNTYAYIMPRERSIDIDTQLDFDFAEFILRKQIESD